MAGVLAATAGGVPLVAPVAGEIGGRVGEEIEKGVATHFSDPVADESDHATLLHFLVDEHGSPGIILPGSAAKATCGCVTVDGDHFCTRRGVIGLLKRKQVPELCDGFVDLPDGRRRRIEDFRSAARTCKTSPPPGGIAGIPKGQRLRPWLTCMSQELKAKGIQL